MEYADFRHLRFDHRDNGLVRVTIDRPEVYNATNFRLHRELTDVWRTLDADPAVRAVLITGAGKAFSAGGDKELLGSIQGDPKVAAEVFREAIDLVHYIIDCEKPIVSAINGPAVGAGLAVALMADISIIAESARLTDGHVRLGVAAGDHAAMLWPLLCGMAKAKYYLLTAEFLDGREAERIGLVSKCVPDAELMEHAEAVANKLAEGSATAIRWTKRSLNHWLRQAAPILETSAALEMLGFLGADAAEGVRALNEKRAPVFGRNE